MTQMRKELAVTEETTLLPFLLREVTGKSRNTVKGLLTRRQVMVDGAVITRFDAPLLQCGDPPSKVLLDACGYHLAVDFRCHAGVPFV